MCMRFFVRLAYVAGLRGDLMRYPCLVPKRLCKTSIILKLDQEGVQENGEPFEQISYDGKCNYQDSAKRLYTEEKKIIQLTGCAMFPGDICPKLPVISSGTATIYGVDRAVIGGRKNRNPDGTVNNTEVWIK